ncbi:MAG: Ig-like domain-containing protein, partial [Rhodothermales bacterium]|nr:Ig-like domain-containing protein [Rhodothermales bacterium]
ELAVPANGEVNVSTTVVRITFDEYITEASLQQALSITPEPTERPEIRWRKKTAEIRFKQELESNTTYILTVDTKLRDSRGVSLTSPITLAFSTGPRINRGKISGRVLEPLRGNGAPSMQVFAYPLLDGADLDSLPPTPLYRTETGEDGRFQFDYLSLRAYFVLAVRDRNGNRRPDNLEVIALPPFATIFADSSDGGVARPWLTTVLDTVPPSIRRVESLSPSRLAVRYSEDVLLTDSEGKEWGVSDSLRDEPVDVEFVYQLPDDRREVFLQTRPVRSGVYYLMPGVVTDSVGNPASQQRTNFRVDPTRSDAAHRFVGFEPRNEGTPLHPSRSPIVIFDRPATPDEIMQWVSVEDTAGATLGFTSTTRDGVRHLLAVVGSDQGSPFVIKVAMDSTAAIDSTRQQQFSYLSNRELGGIVGVIADVPPEQEIFVEAFMTGDDLAARSSRRNPDGTFSIGQLREGSYTLRMTQDTNGNGRWDGGSIDPYAPAERAFWASDSVRVRPRWDTDVDTIRIPQFMPD